MYDFLNALAAYMFIIFVFYLIAYFIFSAAIYKVLVIMRYLNPWFAWIPWLRLYALGDICSQTTDRVYTVADIEVPNWVMRFGWILCSVVVFIPYLGALCSIVLNVIYYGTICDFLYKRIEGVKNTGLAVISGYFKIILVVKVFMWDKNNIKFVSASTDVYPSRQGVNDNCCGGGFTGGNYNSQQFNNSYKSADSWDFNK